MPGHFTEHDLTIAGQLASLNTKMDNVIVRLSKAEEKLDGVVTITNRWKGAGALIVFCAMVMGYASNYILRLFGKGA